MATSMEKRTVTLTFLKTSPFFPSATVLVRAGSMEEARALEMAIGTLISR